MQRYQLESIPGEGIDMQPVAEALAPTERLETIVQRIVRDTRVAQHIKAMHQHQCQVCDIRLEAPAGPYAEAAHIQPLGSPHNGPDSTENILCLCPNHHVLFDRGAFSIRDDLSLIGLAGALRTIVKHQVVLQRDFGDYAV